VTSRANPRFWKAFSELSTAVQEQARHAYKLFATNPAHPSLRFKKVHRERPIYSARINAAYRVVGVLRGDTIIWFWAGDHDAYERLIKSM
jgi:hypothetical protein